MTGWLLRVCQSPLVRGKFAGKPAYHRKHRVKKVSDRLSPQLAVSHIGRRYPGVWKKHEQVRSQHHHDWPRWCYCPLTETAEILASYGAFRAGDIGVVGALAAWKATQGIYRFDPDLQRALMDTPVKGDLPVEVLEHLPGWCVYVEMDPSGSIQGFWAHLEWDEVQDRRELRLVLHPTGEGRALVAVPIHLGVGGLEEALRSMAQETPRPGTPVGWLADLLEPLISLLLYLCSAAAEIRDSRTGWERGAHSPDKPKRRKKRRRSSAGRPSPTTWDVGWRFGAALRASRKAAEGSGGSAGAGSSPRPHIRRAHWHTYRVGKGRRKRVLRWVHPIMVGTGERVATVHRVALEPPV